jgi:CDGSH-type Zn-finger protein
MDPVVVKVRHNGPYKITGPVKLIDADEREYYIADRGETIVLCRCGNSRSKPFCDGSHKRTGFQAPERAVTELG